MLRNKNTILNRNTLEVDYINHRALRAKKAAAKLVRTQDTFVTFMRYLPFRDWSLRHKDTHRYVYSVPKINAVTKSNRIIAKQG